MRHGLERVAKQIDQNLLDLDPVHQHLIVLRVQIEPKLHALLAGAGETERAGFFDQFGKIFDALLGFSPRHEITKPPDDLPGADRLFGSAVQRAFNLGYVGVVTGTQQTARTLHVVADRGERLIELVRKRRRHLSHRAQARDVDQLGLQLLQPCLGLLMFGEIADEAGEVGRSTGLHFADRKMHRKSGSVLALSGYNSTDADDMPFAGGSIAGEVPVMARTVRIWHQDTDVLADRLAFLVAKLPFGGTAEELHDAVAIDNDHRIGNCLQDRVKVAFPGSKRFLDLLLIVDFDHDTAEMAKPSLFVLNDAAARANPVA